MSYVPYFLGLVLVLTGAGAAYLYLELTEHQQSTAELARTLEQAREAAAKAAASSTKEIAIRDATIAELAEQLNLTSEELQSTEQRLRDEKNRNDEFEDRIDNLAGTVSDLDKLSKTDKELLQKYSKVYFLNEHYVPESLKEIDNTWKYSEEKQQQLHSKVMPFFEDMLQDALEDDVEIWVVSAYRSFDQQAQLKGAYTQTYGAGANTFSADQGYSEHQLGTTIDFTTRGLNGGLEGFQSTPAYAWLLEHAHKYGFVLSYPENNGYYIFEPWHWRFVGESLARDLKKADAHFYDWEQREIDSYLISIFD